MKRGKYLTLAFFLISYLTIHTTASASGHLSTSDGNDFQIIISKFLSFFQGDKESDESGSDLKYKKG